MAFDRYTSRLIEICVLLSLVAHFTAALTLEPSTAWETPSTSPEAVQPTATTLTDEEVQCHFENLQSLVDHVVGVNRTSYNISMLVDTCPDVCELVYGAGNPDISGVGAVISYTLQGVTSLIFGPVLALLSLYIGSDKSADSWIAYDLDKLWVAKFFLPVARSIHTANITTAFSVLLAAVIRISGDLLPVGESKFLSTLARFEFLICWVCILSFLPLHTSSRLNKLALGIYVLGTLVLWLVATFSNRGFSAQVIEAIASGCVGPSSASGSQPIGNIILQIPDLAATGSATASATSSGLGTGLTVVYIIDGLYFAFLLVCIGPSILVIVGAIFLYILPLLFWQIVKHFGEGTFRRSAGLLQVGPQRMGALMVVLCLGGFATFFVSRLLVELLRLREQLRDVVGNRYQNNDWGFGQITAVMTWTPVLQETFFAIIRATQYYKSTKASPQERADQETELESLLRGEDTLEAGLPETASTRIAHFSPEASDSESEPVLRPLISANVTGQNTSSMARTTGSHIGPDGTTLQPRMTWPRNESDTYLPR